MVPFSPPQSLDHDLGRVKTYWDSLRRAANSMPFWDDCDLQALDDLKPRLFLVDAFDKPRRFRFDLVGPELEARYGASVGGLFTDEMAYGAPFDYLDAQCSATLEAAAPTHHHQTAPGHGAAPGAAWRAYGRLMLPMWGDGRIGMLLGAIAFDPVTGR